MGAYREQLLREHYKGRGVKIPDQEEAVPSGSLTLFKIKFTICLFLFAGFAYLSITGKSFYHVTAQQIVEAVTENNLSEQLLELGLYESYGEW